MTNFDAIEPATEFIQTRNSKLKKLFWVVVVNAAVITYFVFATLKYIDNRKIYCPRQFRINYLDIRYLIIQL